MVRSEGFGARSNHESPDVAIRRDARKGRALQDGSEQVERHTFRTEGNLLASHSTREGEFLERMKSD